MENHSIWVSSLSLGSKLVSTCNTHSSSFTPAELYMNLQCASGCVCVCECVLSRVWLFATPGTVAYQAPLSVEFARQEFWEWVVIPFSWGSSQPRDQTWVFCVAGGFFTIWATREAQCSVNKSFKNYYLSADYKEIQSFTRHTPLFTCLNHKDKVQVGRLHRRLQHLLQMQWAASSV